MSEDTRSNSGSIQRLAAILIIFASIFIVYNKTLNNPFIWDDVYLIKDNYFIQNLDNAQHLFDTLYFNQPIEISWRPLTTLSYMLEYSVWDRHTGGYHFVNLTFHFLNALLLFGILISLTGKQWISLGGALVFALHPVQTEAINLVTFREDLLCMFFMLSALSLYIKFRESKGILFLITSLIMFIAALLSKETAVMFPFIIFAYEQYVRKQTVDGKAFGRLILFFVPVVVYMFFRFGPMKGPDEHFIYHNNSVYLTMLMMVQAAAKYLNLIVWPMRQCADYIFNDNPSIVDLATIASMFLLIAFILISYFMFLKDKKIGFGIIWFILFMLPVSNIIPIGVIMAERYLYISSAGFIIAFVLALISISGTAEKPLIPVFYVLLGISVVFAPLTYMRNNVWETELSFWDNTCECAPSSGRASVNLGLAYINMNLEDEAAKALTRAVRISGEGRFSDKRYGTVTRALSNLGVVAARQGRMEQAITFFKQAALLDEKAPLPMINLGVVFLRLGRFEESERYFKTGLSKDPNNMSARLYYALVLKQNGKIDEAMKQCDAILRVSPGSSKALKLKERLLREQSTGE